MKLVPSDFYMKINRRLSDDVMTELVAFESTVDYKKFIWNDMWDGNYYCNDLTNDQLPSGVIETFSEVFDICENFCFLKNTGNVIKHHDVARRASVTIPLNVTDSYTQFWDWDETKYIKLRHNGEVYLQNNKQRHSVKDNGDEFRLFLQLNFFENDYAWVKQQLDEYKYFQ
jgi:hypothetical protein